MRVFRVLLPLLFFTTACRPTSPPARPPAGTPAAQVAVLQRQNDSLRGVLGALEAAQTAGNNTPAAKTLRRYELPTHPVELGDYLEKNEPDMLPAGGQHIETALPLGGNFVFVTSTDGHNYQYGLLQYEARVGKGLLWRRVWRSAGTTPETTPPPFAGRNALQAPLHRNPL